MKYANITFDGEDGQKVQFKVIQENSEIDIKCDFEPPLTDETPSSPQVVLAMKFIDFLKAGK